jgi:hypothetical protein
LKTENDAELSRKTGGKSLAALRALESAGWDGGVSFEIRNWLRARYNKLYSMLCKVDRDAIMYRFLASVLSRRILCGTGVFTKESDGGKLEIGLVPPNPDTPVISPRVYYRSFPLVLSKSQAPFCKITAQPCTKAINLQSFGRVNCRFDFTVKEFMCENESTNLADSPVELHSNTGVALKALIATFVNQGK